MHQQSTIGVRAGQTLSTANPHNRSHLRTDASFPPASLSWALPPSHWQAVRKLLDDDPEMTLADVFNEAVGQFLADIARVAPEAVFKPSEYLDDPADVRTVELPLALLLRLALAVGVSLDGAEGLIPAAIEKFMDGIGAAAAEAEKVLRPGRLVDLPGAIRCRMEGGVS